MFTCYLVLVVSEAGGYQEEVYYRWAGRVRGRNRRTIGNAARHGHVM